MIVRAPEDALLFESWEELVGCVEGIVLVRRKAERSRHLPGARQWTMMMAGHLREHFKGLSQGSEGDSTGVQLVLNEFIDEGERVFVTKGLRRSWTSPKKSDDGRLPSTSDASKLQGPRWTKTRRACAGKTYARLSLDPAAAATLKDDSWKVRPWILQLHLVLLEAFILLKSDVFHFTDDHESFYSAANSAIGHHLSVFGTQFAIFLSFSSNNENEVVFKIFSFSPLIRPSASSTS